MSRRRLRSAEWFEDIVRISDARMSGTAYGTAVLHSAPEAAAGGPLAVVEIGDRISLDVPNRTLVLHVDDADIDARLARREIGAATMIGYEGLFVNHVLQADRGCDFDFLVGQRGARVGCHSH